MHYTDITGLAGVTLSIVAIGLRTPFLVRLQTRLKIVAGMAVAIAAVVPVGGLSAAEFVRGFSGDLSITTLLLLLLFLVMSRPQSGSRANMGAETMLYRRANFHPSRPPAKGKLLILIIIVAFALYPFALGLSAFDPYRLGFGNLWFLAGLLAVTLLAWFLQYTLVVLSMTLAVLAWSVGWYESNNLWNYLIDPWVAVYALLVLVKRSARQTPVAKSS